MLANKSIKCLKKRFEASPAIEVCVHYDCRSTTVAAGSECSMQTGNHSDASQLSLNSHTMLVAS